MLTARRGHGLPALSPGDVLPWPAWVHAEETLVQVAHWLCDYHAIVAGFVPPEGAVWRMGGRWRPGLIIGHNVVEREGFTGFGARQGRLRLLLSEYGWREPVSTFLGVVAERITAHIAGLRSLAAAGDPLFIHIVERGSIQDLETALAELAETG